MYTTTRFFYPHGIEGEEMDNTVKEFETIEKAIKYAHRYNTGVRFAGLQIEDENGKLVYEITSNNDTYDIISLCITNGSRSNDADMYIVFVLHY